MQQQCTPSDAENEYSTRKVIPNFRDAAAAALGERWASTPPGWFEPGGDNPSFFAHNDDDGSSGIDDNGVNDGRILHTRNRDYSRATATPPSILGSRETARTGQTAAADTRETDVRVAAPLSTAPPPASARETTLPPAHGRAVVAAGRTGSADCVSRGEASVAPHSEPSSGDLGDGDGGGGSSGARVARESGTSSKKRPFTTERNNAKDLAQYLGVSGPDNDSGGTREGGGGTRRANTREVGGLTLGVMDELNERDGEGSEDQVRGRRQGVRCFRALKVHEVRQ